MSASQCMNLLRCFTWWPIIPTYMLCKVAQWSSGMSAQIKSEPSSSCWQREWWPFPKFLHIRSLRRKIGLFRNRIRRDRFLRSHSCLYRVNSLEKSAGNILIHWWRSWAATGGESLCCGGFSVKKWRSFSTFARTVQRMTSCSTKVLTFQRSLEANWDLELQSCTTEAREPANRPCQERKDGDVMEKWAPGHMSINSSGVGDQDGQQVCDGWVPHVGKMIWCWINFPQKSKKQTVKNTQLH